MKSKKYLLFTLVAAICLFLTACTSSKEPATAAIKAAEDALAASRAEAVKFVPDQVKSVEDAIKAAKASFEKGNFDEALNTAKTIPDKVKEINAAVAARKENLAKNWADISGGIPGMLEAIRSRLDTLKAGRSLPRTLDKSKLESAEKHYEIAVTVWDVAKSFFSEGKLADAIAMAESAKEDAVKAMELLELQMPAAATK
ncbi:MAG: hypothetical protein LLG97_01585 [Deltaproteobacteria bacterium]|nr:hypothetical protein [Deltaproteobacteria bacterium]